MKKNILVVDDSALMRKVFCDIIDSDERFHVMNKAVDGVQALDLLRLYDYDAVVLDINMPNMDGIELLKEMQRYQINTRVMLTSSSLKQDASRTMDALELGATDFIHKPNNISANAEFREDFLRILAAVAGSKAVVLPKKPPVAKEAPPRPPEKKAAPRERAAYEKPAEKNPGQASENPPVKRLTEEILARKRAALNKSKPESAVKDSISDKKHQTTTSSIYSLAQKAKAKEEAVAKKTAFEKPAPAKSPGAFAPVIPATIVGSRIVAIASSTGGPKALHPVISSLPKNLAAPVVLVQHMPEGFTRSLAERLNSVSEVDVKEANEGETLMPGRVYIAKGGKHLNVDYKSGRYTIRYSNEPSREGVKPCANYMYESLVTSAFDEIICVVLTGMGADGTEGIMNLKKSKKIHVIVQEKSTCAVYGMPKSVVGAGLADKILPLDQIAQEIVLNVGVK